MIPAALRRNKATRYERGRRVGSPKVLLLEPKTHP
jgi:hypothetical protein